MDDKLLDESIIIACALMSINTRVFECIRKDEKPDQYLLDASIEVLNDFDNLIKRVGISKGINAEDKDVTIN